MRNVLFYIAGAATVGAFFTLWCAVAVQRVRKESEASKYGELCARIQKQIDETRMRISSVKMQLHIADVLNAGSSTAPDQQCRERIGKQKYVLTVEQSRHLTL